jgi:hypothetical protein
MKIHIDHGDIHLLDLQTRMPFKYGIATMTRTPHAFVRLMVEVGGRPSVGVAADHLPPKWFTKDPARPIDDEVADMLRVIDHAAQVAAGVRADSPFDAWRQLDAAQAEWGRSLALPPLLTQFGTSLVERAMIEALCRASGQPFARLLRTDAFGMRLGEIHPVLAGRTPADLLPEQPLDRIIARHTVGLADPLVDADIGPRRTARRRAPAVAGRLHSELRPASLQDQGQRRHRPRPGAARPDRPHPVGARPGRLRFQPGRQ